MFLCYILTTMKRYWPLLVIVAILVAVVGMSQYAESANQHCKKSAREVKAASVAKGDDNKASEDAEDACKSPVWARYFTWPEGVGAWAVILTLLAIAWQSVETRASVTQGKDTAERQLRAYMVPGRGKLLIREAGVLELRVEIVNSGQTPAYDLQGFVQSGFSEYPVIPPRDASELIEKSKAIVGSGKTFHGGGFISQTQAQIQSLRSDSDRVFFVIAGFTYINIFKKSHHLRIQMVLGKRTGIRTETDESGNIYYILLTDTKGTEGD